LAYFALPDIVLAVPRASELVFIFYATGLVFDGTECFRARFHVLRSRTRFGRYRGRRVPISCFAISDSFSTVARTLGPVGIFCAPGHVFGGTEGVGARFDVSRSRTFLAVPRALGPVFKFCAPGLVLTGTEGVGGSFLCFALLDSFWAVPRASGTVFKFCAPRLVFDGTKVVGAHFHDLRSLTLFRRYRGRRGSFSSFAILDTFLAVPRA
jgi:hypothetical protein